jgi:RNA polymerase sigma factor for flagellar operon FliA
MQTATAAPSVRDASIQQYPNTPEDMRNEPSYPIWVRLRAGDRGARGELVLRYAPLVKYVIGRLAITLPYAMDSDDVLSAGTLGLLQAIDRYDPNQGVRFETYALQRIRGAIIDAIRSLGTLSRRRAKRARLLEETDAALAQRMGRTPTEQELATELQIDLAELSQIRLDSALVIVPLSQPKVSSHDDESEIPWYGDMLDLTDPQSADPLTDDEEVERLNEAIETLSERERLVLSLYYHDDLMLKEISRVLELSEGRISQIHVGALRKLRMLLRYQPTWHSVVTH